MDYCRSLGFFVDSLGFSLDSCGFIIKMEMLVEKEGIKKNRQLERFFLLFLKFFKRFSIRYISFRGLLFSRVIFYMAFFEYMR